jgi:hypothetical protein
VLRPTESPDERLAVLKRPTGQNGWAASDRAAARPLPGESFLKERASPLMENKNSERKESDSM